MKYLSVLFSLSFLLGCYGAKVPTLSSKDQSDTQSDVAEAKAASAADTEAATDNSGATDGDAEEATGPDEAARKEIEGAEQKNVKLVVEDQATAGQIIVKTVATSRDGWVSVHKSQADGSMQTPESIGQARVDSGDSEDIVVDLWEAPAVGDKLWVLLHVDAGDRGLYEFPDKDVAVYKNGEIMARSFEIESSDQAADEE
ncbi:hypothetical protein [Leptolyngbya sp. BC1307]|uniref:DUF7282 domain-containing protein n=1 Tax=Leptolyngbya sp. BC1307 TaxID=2029589 RepID=UPI000EFC8092|nr:hypothetical protein [Leptolyngbya sp. BC1307]